MPYVATTAFSACRADSTSPVPNPFPRYVHELDLTRAASNSPKGYKGVVVIDHRLEGIKMRLRPSMNKFEALEKDVAPIEIARWFDHPGTSYLNKYVVFHTGDRGALITISGP